MSEDGATSSNDAKVNDPPEQDHQHHRIDRPDKSMLRKGLELDLVTLSKLSLEDTDKIADYAPDHAELSRLTLTDIPQSEAARSKGGRTTQHLQASKDSYPRRVPRPRIHDTHAATTYHCLSFPPAPLARMSDCMI